jgi:YNFM family putative membrane transporter
VLHAFPNRSHTLYFYLSCYFFGGMAGSAVLGQIFDRLGWPACVAGIGASLAITALLAGQLR